MSWSENATTTGLLDLIWQERAFPSLQRQPSDWFRHRANHQNVYPMSFGGRASVHFEPGGVRWHDLVPAPCRRKHFSPISVPFGTLTTSTRRTHDGLSAALRHFRPRTEDDYFLAEDSQRALRMRARGYSAPIGILKDFGSSTGR